MTEADVTKKSIGHFKDDSMFLLDGVESNFHDKTIEKDMLKWKYEQAVTECNKWRSLI